MGVTAVDRMVARGVLLVLLVLVVPATGCFAGGAVAPSGGQDASTMQPLDDGSEGQVPVPPSATMQGAQRTENDDGSVTFVWEDELGNDVTVARFSDESVQTTLLLPGGLAFQIDVVLDLDPDDAQFGLEVEDSASAPICHRHGLGIGAGPLAIGRLTCGIVTPAALEPRAWTVRVTSDASQGSAQPFTVTVRIAAFPPTGPYLLDEVRPFVMHAADGVTLRGHVYLPDAPRPLPTILLFSPYWGAPSAPTDAYAFELDGMRTMEPTMGVNLLLEAGYAVALVNLRGTGASDGCYSYMNLPRIGPDANAVIDALAGEPWSDGSVGMHGISYLGAAQFAAIAWGPSPHLEATVAVSGHWDLWLAHSYYGVAKQSTLFHAGNRNRQQGLGVTSQLPLGPVGVGQVTPNSWCGETPSAELAAWHLALNGDKVGWYAERDLSERLAGKRVPMMTSFGLDGDGHIMETNGIWDVLDGPKRLYVGPWGHDPPRDDWQWFTRTQALPWFDHFMRDGPSVATGRVDHQDDEGTWRVAERWPPHGRSVTLHLGDGTLSLEAPTTTSERTFINNDLTGSWGDGCDQTDHAFYVSPPLAEDIVVVGNFLVNLTLTSTERNGNVIGTLDAVQGQPDCASWSHDRWLQYAIGDLRHRGHQEIGEDYPIGRPDRIGLISAPLVKVVPADSRLVLSVKAGMIGLVPKPQQPVLTVHAGGELASTVQLTVVDGALSFAGTSVPS